MPYSNEIAVLKKFLYMKITKAHPIMSEGNSMMYFYLLQLEKGYKTILLDTPHNTERAHKFYHKAGFRQVKETELPIKFSHPYKDCVSFYLSYKLMV